MELPISSITAYPPRLMAAAEAARYLGIGETICDAFMGTGSTGVAAIKAGKTFTGIEHDPQYFETAVRRIGAAYEESMR